MAVNESRDMNAELQQGVIDGRYQMLAPNWSLGTTEPEWERLGWPQYGQTVRPNHMNRTLVHSDDRLLVERSAARVARDTANHAGVRHTHVSPGAYHFGH